MSEMENNSEPKLSRDEWEEMFFDASDAKIEIQEPKGKPKYDPIDWDALGDNERRCKNCDHWREENGLGDFICRNIRGYKEAPVHIRRCDNCNEWKKEKGIGGDFWCKHNKHHKLDWDQRDGYEGAAERASEIREWRQLVGNAK